MNFISIENKWQKIWENNQELKKLNAAYQWDNYEKQCIPTLKEALEILPDCAVANIDLKPQEIFTNLEDQNL